MSMIVYLALIAAAVVALRHGPGQALLRVYLPVLLLLPDAYRAITPGLPDPNFPQAAILPIVFLALLRYGRAWRLVWMDGLMLLFAVWVAYSDYIGRGYADAQNLMFAMISSVFAPYVVGRLVVAAEQLDVALGRRFVTLVFGVALVGLWEFRFGFNPFLAILNPFFPGQADGWVTTFRHGVARVAGPYSHAILAGIMMAIAYRLQRWLHEAGLWEARFRHLPWVPWPKARVITAVLLLGLLMTVARGPWLGALIGGGLAMVGQASNRPRALWISAALVAVGALAGAFFMADYLDIKPGATITASQESALYRKILFEKYLDIALDHAWFGWGVTTWPKVLGMESIDNYFLLLSLMHGVPAMLMLVLMLLGASVQCVRRGLAEPADSGSPAFAFAGIFVTIFVSLGTVFLGGQVLPVLFLVLGWSQGWLQAEGGRVRPLPAQPSAPPRPEFRHVIR
ncbi:O-antigen ligase family protein [Roseateles oligotrophus]|uniref:O-antigen ligase family protein n=1 Tax=Roseateles oligotrophus TaxID=1769250 RepID=A0ABT2YFP9_9BURK|nr:O-antigen ligase family protein [Roseateles oligotrophus]MCV2368877.1 O-antigen ligase family protein [Roseateles oligotrophus]